MVFNSSIFVIAIALWLVGLSAWILYRELSLRRVFASTQHGDARALLEQLLRSGAKTEEEIRQIEQLIAEIQRKDKRHIQKLGLIRFNPFRDAGGNQSFALAVLNEDNSGFVLTSLHARETTRFYIKDVVRGSGKSELSKEEKQAIEQALTK